MYQKKSFDKLLKGIIELFPTLYKKIESMIDEDAKSKLQKKANKLSIRVQNIFKNRDKIDTNLVFDFVEGNLIKAIKQGDWILIDEINLANNEVLQKLLPVIEGKSLLLYEKGKTERRVL